MTRTLEPIDIPLQQLRARIVWASFIHGWAWNLDATGMDTPYRLLCFYSDTLIFSALQYHPSDSIDFGSYSMRMQSTDTTLSQQSNTFPSLDALDHYWHCNYRPPRTGSSVSSAMSEQRENLIKTEIPIEQPSARYGSTYEKVVTPDDYLAAACLPCSHPTSVERARQE